MELIGDTIYFDALGDYQQPTTVGREYGLMIHQIIPSGQRHPIHLQEVGQVHQDRLLSSTTRFISLHVLPSMEQYKMKSMLTNLLR